MDKDSENFKKLLARVIRELKKSSKDKEEIVSFANHFFSNGNADDFTDYAPRDIAAIARSAFEFREHRQSGKSKIRIFNPDPASDGWNDPHTVIEILNDDMPFLVDSVLDELAESSIPITLLLHPVEKLRRLVKTGAITTSKEGSSEARESFIHIHVERIGSTTRRTNLLKRL